MADAPRRPSHTLRIECLTFLSNVVAYACRHSRTEDQLHAHRSAFFRYPSTGDQDFGRQRFWAPARQGGQAEPGRWVEPSLALENAVTIGPFGRRWRTGRDSNPRWLLHHARFPSVCLKPLGHLSLSAVGRPYSAVDSSGNAIFPPPTGLARSVHGIWGFGVLFRAVGWLLLALAIAAVVHDALAWWTEGSFHLLGLGDLWSHLDVRSLERRAERGPAPCRPRCGTGSSGRS